MNVPKKEISILGWLIAGWKIFANHWMAYLFYSLLVFLLSNLGGGLFSFLFPTAPYLLLIISTLITIPFLCGFYSIFLKLTGGTGEPQLKDLFKGFTFFWQANLANLLILLFFGIGMILLVLPGLVVSALYMFTFPVMVEKQCTFWEAMETSRKMVWRYWFPCTLFGMITLGIMAAGLLTLIGILVALPWVISSSTIAYKEIRGLTPPGGET